MRYISLDQLKYILIAFSIFTFASIDFIPNYGIDILPCGFIPVVLFVSIICYSIAKLKLLDLSIAISRTTVFLIVYALILGVPFTVAFGFKEKLISIFSDNWWVFPLVLSTLLGSIGPIFYLYLQRKTEDRILKEQRAYQNTLRRASVGMGRIKDLGRLVKLVVRIVMKAVRIEYCAVYLFHEDSEKFVLKSERGMKALGKFSNIIPGESEMVDFLKILKEPIVYEEMKQRAQFEKDRIYKHIEKQMALIPAEVVIPSFIEDKLIGLLILGKKKTGELYSSDDLSVFAILANQASLAIENAMFYLEVRETQNRLFKADKMATIGTMADGLSHQINNRFHSMGFIAGDALDTILIKLKDSDRLPKDTQELLEELRDSLTRIQENVKRGGEVVGGLLRYTRKSEEGFGPIKLAEVIDAAVEMAQFKIKFDKFVFHNKITLDMPTVHGNFTQLQEVFFNIIDNSYDSIMQRYAEINEPGFKGSITIWGEVNRESDVLKVYIRDTGMGVTEDNMQKLFTPFFTTKATAKKGTGLGLYVIRQIIEEHHFGKVKFESIYRKWAQTTLTIPLSKEAREQVDDIESVAA